MAETCHWCKRPGHWASGCPDRAAGRPRAIVAPVLEPTAVIAPVGSGSPAPGRAAARPGDWRIEGINWRAEPDRATPEAARSHAQAARLALEAKGHYSGAPASRQRRIQRLALEDVYRLGRISFAEYHKRLAELEGVPTIPAQSPAPAESHSEEQAA